jgi:sulfatase maturation enzyme AslB (radical SAM superfamily)
MDIRLQDNTAKILFLGNNDQSTDTEVTSFAVKNNNINHGLVLDAEFTPIQPGYYHTSVSDIPFGSLLALAQRFDIITLLDQPQAKWSHWKCLSASFKMMLQLEALGKTTIFRENANLKNMLFWTDVLYNKNKSFCIYPWINYHNSVHGLTTCSRSNSFITTADKLKDWNTDPDYNSVRDAMIRGDLLPEHCKTCYGYENKGIESYRQFESLDWLTQLEIESFDDLKKIKHPYFYELHTGNHCNIKCRGCQPAFSEPIGKEIKKFNIVAPIELWWTPTKATIDQIDIDTLSKNSSVYFQGGEPTIMPEVLEFMRRCIAKNKTDFFLTMCTNGVKLTDEFLELISHFSNTNFSISIDGFERINDYWRSGSKWSKIIDNAKLLQSRGHFISINTVPGIYNVTNLHLLLEFLDREFPFTAIYMQINYLKWQSAFNHPNSQLVIESMKKCMNTSIYQSNGKSCKTAVDSIYEHYMKNPACNIDDLRDFFNYNDQLDRARGVKLADYIPELEAARSLL